MSTWLTTEFTEMFENPMLIKETCVYFKYRSRAGINRYQTKKKYRYYTGACHRNTRLRHCVLKHLSKLAELIRPLSEVTIS